MPEPRPEVLDFLLSRRSRPAKTLGDTAPDRSEIETFLTAASRTPDHGKLVPWRFIVVTEGRDEIAATFTSHAERAGLEPEKIEKNARSFSYGGVIIAVVASPNPDSKIPVWEQELAAGGVCLNLLNAALAAGWGANWLTGPLARDDGFLAEAFDCQPGEFVAGFIHIGDERMVPSDRDRPEIGAITQWR
ncbi:MAG: nitroreductase [Pseudomonadota bacterium]